MASQKSADSDECHHVPQGAAGPGVPATTQNSITVPSNGARTVTLADASQEGTITTTLDMEHRVSQVGKAPSFFSLALGMRECIWER